MLVAVMVRLHEYRRTIRGASLIQETLCFGQWYPTGTAPCEREAAQIAQDLSESLPDCEKEDDPDVIAMAELLGQPVVSICRTKGRASWQDKWPGIGTTVGSTL